MIGSTRSSGIVRDSITVMSGCTNRPPLNAASGVSSASGSTSIAMPRGGRPLVTANVIPASRSLPTAAIARSVRTLSFVTSVPSTSASISLIGGSAIGRVYGAPGDPGRLHAYAWISRMGA